MVERAPHAVAERWPHLVADRARLQEIARAVLAMADLQAAQPLERPGFCGREAGRGTLPEPAQDSPVREAHDAGDPSLPGLDDGRAGVGVSRLERREGNDFWCGRGVGRGHV